MPSRIEDYAIIGDCQTAALVAKDGSIDWLCFPRFDGGACFAALLGTNEHGRWQIAPRGEVRSTRRRYRDNTLVLETEFETDEGMVSVIDFMPLRQDGADVIRIVVGRRGRVRMKMEFVLRFDYGSIVPWVTQCKHGIRAIAGPDTVYLRSPIGLQGKDFKTTADFEVSEGETIPFALGWSPTYGKPPEERDCQDALRETERWWHEWSSRCTYAGEYREAVLRSLITLKALTYAPTGGICAAVTTSLPEEIGGVRNWDYRFCWLRDATFSLMALEGGGYHEEAAAWRKWLVDAAAGTPAKLQIMYGLAGERRLTELELDWLPGYEASKPVRIGNGAFLQRQLDVYGEVMDALYQSNGTNLAVDDEAWHLQRALARHLVTAWKEPDEGIWEVRGPRQQFTHSKVMTWVAMDRAIKTLESLGDPDNEVVKWKTTRDEIHATVCRAGFDAKLNSFVQYFGSTDPDASLLMIPLVGFLPATDKRMRGTIDLIRKRLTRNGLIDRYPANAAVDGLPPGEGSFLMCTFWLVDNLALLDKGAEATEIFERLLALRNDVGLLSEQYDTIHQRLVGNFPQAFSHVGLINSAANLDGVHGPARLRCQNRATLHRA